MPQHEIHIPGPRPSDCPPWCIEVDERLHRVGDGHFGRDTDEFDLELERDPDGNPEHLWVFPYRADGVPGAWVRVSIGDGLGGDHRFTAEEARRLAAALLAAADIADGGAA